MGLTPKATLTELHTLAKTLPEAQFSNGVPISQSALLDKARCLVPGPEAVASLLLTLDQRRIFNDQNRRIAERDPFALLLLLRSAGQALPTGHDAANSLQEALLLCSEIPLRATLAAAKGLRHQSLTTSSEAQLRKHACATGVCARLLANYVMDIDPEVAFTTGTAFHFGRLVLSIFLPHSYAEIRATAVLTETPLHLLEHAWLGFDGSCLAEQILADFNAPKELQVAVGMQDIINPHNLPEEDGNLIALCQTGSLLAQFILAKEQAPRRMKTFSQRFPLLSCLRINPKNLQQIFDECRWALFDRRLL